MSDLPALATAADSERPPLMRALLAEARARVAAALAAREPGAAVCRVMSDALDGIVKTLFEVAAPSGEPVALLATGGWGRRETCPYSDIDLLFLTAGPPGDDARALAEKLLYPLWDSGLEVGHAVRSLPEAVELAARDLPTMTALLDARFLCGERGLSAALAGEIASALTRGGDKNAFVRRLIDEKASRHAKFGDTLFLLEPNLKHGQGGLRDLATGLWAARARWRVGDLADLVPLGQASARQVATLLSGRDFLLRLRTALHLAARRRQDQLTFELQEATAPSFQLPASDSRAPVSQPPVRAAVAPAVEALMRAYYLTARAVQRATDRLLERALVPPHRPPTIARLEPGFIAFNGQVSVEDAALFRERPAEMVRLFQVALEHQLPIYGHTKEVVAERVAIDGARLADDAEAQKRFLALLCDPRDRRQPSLLEEMHELGLLAALMPEFAPCTGRVQHDLYHVYTVDQHQLYALALLKRIARGELAKEAPTVGVAFQRVERPAALYLGTLLHDVGKPLGKGHSEKGARLCASIARRLGLSPDDAKAAEFLVRHHLLMSHLSQRRDLDDVSMVGKFAGVVENEETLDELYLLTYCDTAMTAPGNLTDWKATLLGELHERTRAFLRRGADLAGADRSLLVSRRRRRVAELLGGEDLEAFFAGVPDRYVAFLSPGAIALHIRLSRQRGDRPVAMAIRHHPSKGYSEVFVVAEDTPGLLARIAGVLTANRIDIIGAHVSSRKATPGEALDVFLVKSRPASDPRWKRVEEDLARVLSGGERVEDLLAARRPKGGLRERVTPAVATEIEIDNEASEDFTVIDVYTHDRLGVLYAITRTLTDLGLDISLSKVATEADRAADVFYVRDRASGAKITDATRQAEISARLRAALERVKGVSAVVGIAGQAGDSPRFRAPRRTRVYTFIGAVCVLALSAATFARSLQPATVMALGEGAAALGMVLPMFQTAVAGLALAVRLASLRIDVDGVGWGWGDVGFLMRRERIGALHLYRDAVAVAPRRGFAWYLSGRDYSPFTGLLAACRRSGIPVVEEDRRAPLGARLQGYGLALDLLLLADILLSTFVFLQ